jgi:hypothetical protein
MKLFKQYLKESLIVENTELADLKKHLHDQQMKYAAAQKRKDKRAMDFWNHAIKNTEEEIKYYENENFSSNDDSKNNEREQLIRKAVAAGRNDPQKFKGMKNFKAFQKAAKDMGLKAEDGHGEGMSTDDMFRTIRYVDKDGDTVGYWQNDPKNSEGVLFNNPTEYARYEREEYEKAQKWIDDEIKAGRDPYRD